MSDWEAFTKLMHPDGLKNFRDVVLPVLQTAAKKDGDDLSKPTAQTALNYAFGIREANDLQPLLALEPDAFFAGVLKASKFQSERQFLIDADYRIIGTVFEAKNLVHVMVETQRELKEVKLNSMEVFTLRQRGREWGIVTSTALEGMLAMVKLLQIK